MTEQYSGTLRIEYRAVCPRHQIKSATQRNEDDAAILAADTRAFCQPCQDEARQTAVTRAHVGDPCRKCGVGHDDVAVGDCPGLGTAVKER